MKRIPARLRPRPFDALAFGDHPYGSTGDGTFETVAALTRDDMIAATRATLARDRIFVAASGDITAAELGAAA
jgi:zinc protease